MTIFKKLTPIGDGEGLILDQALLDAVGLKSGAEVELRVEGQSLIIRRASADGPFDRAARFAEARRHVLSHHGGTLKKLAL